jgi:putative inorganic carbon (hco3(-)) transporter
MKSELQMIGGYSAVRQTSVFSLCAGAGFLMLALIKESPILMAGVLILLACLALMLRWPEAGTLVVLFAIYSNIGVLAMRAPTAVQAAAGSADQNPRIVLVLGGLSLLLCVPLLHQIFACKRNLIFDRGFLLMLPFLVASLASSAFARDAHILLSEITDYLVEGVVLYFLLSNLIRDFSTLRRVMWALLLAGSFMAGLSVLQKATHTERNIYGGLAQSESDYHANPRMLKVVDRSMTTNDVSDNGEVTGQLRAAGPIGEPNRYGQVLLVLLPLAVLQFGTGRSRRLRVIAVAAGGVILCGVLLTFSRGNLVAAIVSLGLMAYCGLLKPRQVAGAVLGVTLVVGVFQPAVVSRMLTLERVTSLFSGKHDSAQAPDSSAVRRYVENVAAWRVFLDHPVLGVGPGHFAAYYSNDYSNRLGLVEQTHYYRAHNLYLETLAETGIVGFACFVSILGVTMRGLWQERRRLMSSHPELAHAATAFFVSLSAYAVSAVFAHLSYPRYFWLLLAVSSAAIRVIHSESQARETAQPLLCTNEA